MGNRDLLYESIFKRKLSAPGTSQYLERITQQYPYFTPAQFFLLLQTGKGSVEYQELAGKTAILFNNPYWLQFQLQEMELGREAGAASSYEPALLATEEPDNILIAVAQPTEPGKVNHVNGVGSMDRDEGAENEGPIDGIITERQMDTLPGEIASEDAGQPDLPAASEKEQAGPVENAGEPALERPEANFIKDQDPVVNEIVDGQEPGPEEPMEPLNFKLKLDDAPVTEDEIIFEPLHTSDYFASVGIKLSNEIKPGDRLGKQLKSFTQWLKTMKKVHYEQVPDLGPEGDKKIQQLAEQSNKEDVIVTEAMADVLLRQGKGEKAVEVYQKLSLLNPSKSAYFAAKIDQLKAH
jgi:hypothetical protein